MRRVVVQAEISFDGVLDNPDLWSLIFNYHNGEITQYLRDQLFASDALIMGRITYEGFAEFWPSRAGQDEMADRMNSLPKFVASRTLKEPLSWNARLMNDAAEAVAQLKQQPGQNILQYGIGELTYTLLQRGLVDEFRFLIYPFAIGKGQRIFENIDTTTMKLVHTKTFDTGVVLLHYQPQPKA